MFRIPRDDLDQLELLKPTVSKRDLVLDLRAKMGGGTFKNFAKLLKVMAALGIKYKFTLPPFYVLVLRSLGTLEGIALQVDAEFEIVSEAVPSALVILQQSGGWRRAVKALWALSGRRLLGFFRLLFRILAQKWFM